MSDFVFASADTNAALVSGPDPIKWVPAEHVGRLHVAVPDSLRERNSDRGKSYVVLVLRHLLVFHQGKRATPIVYRYDNVDVSQQSLRRTWTAQDANGNDPSAYLGILATKNPEAQYPRWEIEPCDADVQEQTVKWLTENSQAVNGQLHLTAYGDNHMEIQRDDSDDLVVSPRT